LNLESFRNFCLSRKGATEDFPFDENTIVFKVMGKMFALTDINDFSSINLKVDPEMGIELRERYSSVQEGYHMNKKHWITVLMNGELPDRLVLQWADNSYNLVVSGLTKSQKSALDVK
jgi:predicted DNA-binding protein (MmcQ/YjbR family)